MQEESLRRIVVTGIGVVTPLGHEVELVLGSTVRGRVRDPYDLTTLDTSTYKVHFGGDIPDFDVEKFVDAPRSQAAWIDSPSSRSMLRPMRSRMRGWISIAWIERNVA